MTPAEQSYNPVGYGHYYCRLMVGEYSRQTPFEEAEWAPKEAIMLPLPTELRDDTGVGYSNLDLNSVGDIFNMDLAGAGAAIGLRNSGAMARGLMDAAGRLIPSSVANMASQVGIDGDLVRNTFPTEQITSAIQQSLGMAPNPNPSVAFSGPSLREFTMTWAFYPKNVDEAAKIKRVITTLKKRALPENTIGATASVLNYPHMCQLNFFPWDRNGRGNWGWHPENSIIRIKRCVMSSVNVNYTPSNTPAFHPSAVDGQQAPVATQLTINFKELEYMLSNDWGGTSAGTSPGDAILGAITDLSSRIGSALPEALVGDVGDNSRYGAGTSPLQGAVQ